MTLHFGVLMPAMCEPNDEMYAKDPSAVTASPLYPSQESSCRRYSGEAVTADGSFAYISSFASHMAGISTPKQPPRCILRKNPPAVDRVSECTRKGFAKQSTDRQANALALT